MFTNEQDLCIQLDVSWLVHSVKTAQTPDCLIQGKDFHLQCNPIAIDRWSQKHLVGFESTSQLTR